MNASRKVLVVDDEELIRDLLASFLASEGHQVLQAGSLEEAKSHLKNPELALAIVDVNLSKGDAGKRASAIRGSNALARHLTTRKIPVIRVTGTPHELDPQFKPGGRFAPVGVLGKPFSLAQLHGLLVKALNPA